MVALGPRVGGAYVSVSMRLNNRSINLLGGQIHRQLAKIGERNRGMYQSLGRESVVMWRTMLAAATTGAPLIGSAISGVSGAVTMLVGAMRETVVSAGGLIGIAGSVGFAMMTMSFGFNHVIDAIKEIDPKKLEQQLAAMTPPAREFTLAMRDLMKTLQEEVQPRIFAGLLTEMEALRSDFIPVVTKGFLGMADALNGLMKGLVQYATSKDGLATINTALQGSVTIFEHLSKAVVPFLDGFLKFHNALIPASIRLSDRIAGIAERFQAWSSAPGFAERIDDRMKMAEKTAGLLFKVLGNLGSAIGNIFTAINPQTNTFLEMLVDVTERFKDWSSSVEGSESLQTWASAAIDVMAAFGRAISSVFKVLTALADPRVIISFLDTVAGAFDHLNKLPLADIVSKFADFAEYLQPISSYFLAIIIAGASFNVMLGAVAGQLGGVARIAVSAIDGIKRLFSPLAGVGKHAAEMKGLSAAFSRIGTLVIRGTKFIPFVGWAIWIGTLIAKSEDLQKKFGKVWDALKEVFSAVGSAFSDVAKSLKPVTDGLGPVFDFLDKIAGIALGVVFDMLAKSLSGLAKVISGAGRALAGFIDLFVGLFTADLGKILEGVRKIGSGIFDVLSGLIASGLSAITGLFENLGIDAVNGLMEGLMRVTEYIKDFGNWIIDGVKSVLGISSPSTVFMQIGTWVVEGLVNGITAAASWVWNAFKDIVSGIWDYLSALPGDLKELGVQAITFLANAVIKGVARLRTIATNIKNAVVNVITTIPAWLFTKGSEMVSRLANAVTTGVNRLRTIATNIKNAVINVITTLPALLFNQGAQMVSRLASAVTVGVSRLRTIATNIKNAVLNPIKNLPAQLLQTGRDMISNLVSGITGGIDRIKGAIGRVTSTIRNFLPGSPGKEGPLTAWNYGGEASGGGRNVIEALTAGLGNTGPIKRAMGDVASTIAQSFTPGRIDTGVSSTSVPARGGDTYNIDIRMEVSDLDSLKTLDDFLAHVKARDGARGRSRLGVTL